MKELKWLFCLCLFTASLIHAQDPVTYGEWTRSEMVDQLTRKVQVSYRFTQLQPDGRSPYIFVFCADGKIRSGAVGYFADVPLYFDAALGLFDPNHYGIRVDYRGASGTIGRAYERVEISDGHRMTLSADEIGTFGRTGELVMQYASSSGGLITDAFKQQGISLELKQMMEAECYSPKKKR